MRSVGGALPSGARPSTRVALDSGAVAVRNRNIVIDIDAYIGFVHPIEHMLDFYVNLDVIGNGPESYENWLYMRSKGLDPMAVYHYGTPIDYVDKYLRQTDRIGIGGFRGSSTKKREEILDWLWSNDLVYLTGHPRGRIHGLGLTSATLVTKWQWYSVDSTTWALAAGNRVILVPRKSITGYDYTKPPMSVSVTLRRYSRGTNHVSRLPEDKAAHVMQYLKERGFKLGNGYKSDPDYEPGLCNDPTMRYQLNAIYYMEMGRANRTKVYLAGNYESLQNPEMERSIQQAVYSQGLDYYRLVSFADKREYIMNIINMKKEEED